MGMCGDGKPGWRSAPGTARLDDVELGSFRFVSRCLPPSCCLAPAGSQAASPPASTLARSSSRRGCRRAWWEHGLVLPVPVHVLNPLGDGSQ